MAEGAGNLDVLNSCPVCYEHFEQDGDHLPRLLPCTHTVCETCIKKLIRHHKLECPECRATHHATNEEKSFAQNKYLLTLIKKKATEVGDEKKFKYQFELCEEHEKDLTLFCKENGCEKPICRAGLTKQHKKHDIVEIEEAKIENLQQQMYVLRSNFTSKLDNVSAMEKKITLKTRLCLNNLRKKKAEIDAIFTKLENEVMAEDKSNKSSFYNDISALKVNLTVLENIGKNIEGTIVTSYEEIMKNFETIEEIGENNKEHLSGPRTYKVPVFQPAEKISVGNLTTEEIDFTLPENKIQPKFIAQVEQNIVTGNPVMSAITMLSDNIVATCGKQCSDLLISCYDLETGELSRSEKLGAEPWEIQNVILDGKSTLAVAYPYENFTT